MQANCAGCGRTFFRKTGTHRFCTSACRERHRGHARRQRYGSGHQRSRAAVAVAVEQGRALCSRCGELIEPGTPWDLDHDDNGNGYLGPSHARCNRATTPRARKTGLCWSRRWFEDATEDTIVGNEEIRRDGRWEPL
ncbi:MAG TPA: hypothetical protein VFT94_01585 [Gaiellaceae bacterium]|nr:hypothetical protein [Gaiellaceae bacterium]